MRTYAHLSVSSTSPEIRKLSSSKGTMNCICWINKHRTGDTISGMSISRPRHLQLPLTPRTLLITDVTRLQPFTVGGDKFRESIETLVSYNVCNDRLQDCLYIEQGHLMMPTSFMSCSMAIDPRKSIVVTWTPVHLSSMQQGFKPSSLLGSPAYTSS